MLDLRQLPQQCLFLGANFLRHLNINLHEQVAQAHDPRVGHALTFQAENISGLRPSWNFHFTRTVERRNFESRT